jgi:hypothetical protein
MVWSRKIPMIPILRKYSKDSAPNFLMINMVPSLAKLGKEVKSFYNSLQFKAGSVS